MYFQHFFYHNESFSALEDINLSFIYFKTGNYLDQKYQDLSLYQQINNDKIVSNSKMLFELHTAVNPGKLAGILTCHEANSLQLRGVLESLKLEVIIEPKRSYYPMFFVDPTFSFN